VKQKLYLCLFTTYER